MPRFLTFRLVATARCCALLVLFSVLGCSDSGALGSPDSGDGDVAAKAGLDNPPVAVGAFFDGVFPPRTPNAPGTSTWDVVAAFPALNLGDTLVIAANPSNDRLYVGRRDGLIRSFDNQPDVASADPFLDLRDRTAVVWDGGFLGLVFHPEFGVPGSPNRNFFYVFYSSHCPLNGNRDAIDLSACDQGYPMGSTGGFFNTYLRLSRYEVPDGSTTADPSSERIMLNIRLYNGSHRGGGMVFRNDGYLHVTIGDQFHYDTAQDIVDTLEGGSMRFAVDITDNGDGTWSCPPGSHLPRRIFDTFDEISGQWYCIPNDNPWLDPGGGVFEEYCSIGHRNPHRLAWDPVTDYMWSGEIGETTREEINVIFCGNNYGWPFREGLVDGPFSEPSSFLGTLTDPVIDFVRSEARAIIGGYVYRGSQFAELYGRYLAGDYSTGNIWAITLDESTMTATKEFLTVFDPGGLGTWGQDNNGEVYLGDVINGGPIYTLERIGQSVPDPPSLLSATGAFNDTLNVVPDTAWVPYALNQPFWSDGADKSRWIAVPNDGLRNTAAEQIAFSETGDWSFPIGTVLMKHFELPTDETDPSVTDRLETRFLVHGDDGEWYGLTYRWRADGTDADLLIGADTSLHTISLAGGGTRDQTWNYPSRFDCISCHRSIGVLGPRTHQLNGNFTYPSTGRTDNQLATWNHLSMFTPAIVEADIPTMIRSKALGDVSASLQDRARSWLDSNCSNCHRPGEVVAGFDTRYTVPLEGQGLLWGAVRDDLGMVGTAIIFPGDPNLSAVYRRIEALGPIAMPPLAKELAQQPAVDLMGEWILRIDPSIPQSPNDPPTLQTPPDQANSSGESVVLNLVGNDPDGDLLYFDAAGLPGGLSIDHLTGQITGTLDPSQLDGTYGVTASASDGPAVAVVSFDWVLGEPSCGNGTLEVGEECDDGNNTNGDGCASDCTIEVTQVCGDGVVTPPETCEPPNTAFCNGICTARVPLCGDGFLTPPEACEDGNTADGDGCSSTCQVETTGQDLTDLGTVIARVTSPIGGGNHDLEVIRDGDFAPVGSQDDARQYDSWDGFNTSPNDWIGYSYTSGQTFGKVVFQEGKHFFDGGWFDSLTVQVRQGGVWNEVTNLAIVPAYPGNNGITYETFEMTFDPAAGDGIRIYGAPGGSADFISVGELEVFAPGIVTCGNGALDAGEQCDDGNTTGGDGCGPTCLDEFCGDGIINNNGTETCEPPGTAVCELDCTVRLPICGDGFITPPETCEDGNTNDGDGCSSQCLLEGGDLTDVGTIIAAVPNPVSGGNPDSEIIRDDDIPPVGTIDSLRQFDTWNGANVATEDWIGYAFPSQYSFNRVVFQEGMHFFDGGWFDTLTVQVRQGGTWVGVTGFLSTPAYAGNNGITYETYELTFDPAVGDAIRIFGAPGGSADFISVAELEVYGDLP